MISEEKLQKYQDWLFRRSAYSMALSIIMTDKMTVAPSGGNEYRDARTAFLSGELFSIDTEVACDKCGFVAYNDELSCVQWCEHAKACVGEAMYEHLMKIAAAQKRRRAG